MKAIALSQANSLEWDRFVDTSDEAWLWHRSDHIFNHASMPGKENASFLVVDNRQRILGVMPLHCITSKKLILFGLNKLISQGGPATVNELDLRARNDVLMYVADQIRFLSKQTKAIQIEVTVSPLASAHRQHLNQFSERYAALGGEFLPSYAYVVDLQKGADSIWAKMETRARTSIRKGLKEGVRVRGANLDNDLDIYYDLHTRTYDRTGARPHPRKYFETIWKRFYARGMAHILFAERENRIIAAASFGIYKKRAVFWTGASNEEGLRVGANAVLQWQAMQDFASAGFEFYETGKAFPGVGGKLAGLDKFKRSFGGELEPYLLERIVTRPRLARMLSIYKRPFG